MRVGFIGLGRMGQPMVRALLRGGFRVTVHNRSLPAVEALWREGAAPAYAPAEIALLCDVVLTCLPDPDAVESVYTGRDGILEAAWAGQLLIDHSTVVPDLSRRLYADAHERGAAFLDAPVSGGVAGARDASLTIMAGGDAAAFQRALPVLRAIGRNVRHVGPAGAGTAIKLANQLLVGIHTVAAAEALALATRAGADPGVALEVISASFGNSAMLQRHGPMILQRRFDGGTPIDLILKDLRLITGAGDELGLPLDLAEAAQRLFADASEHGLGGLDMAAMVQPLEQAAGFTVRSEEPAL